MKQSTVRDIQRVTFVDSLHKELRQQAEAALDDRDHLIQLASSFVNDGLSDEESIELMMIEADVTRETAKGYVSLSQNDQRITVSGDEYSFQFSDIYGKVWSSHDIDLNVFASSKEEAWETAEGLIFEVSDVEAQSVLSVDRMS